MQRLILTVLACLVGQVAAAETTLDELRAMIFANDIDAVEAALAAAHRSDATKDGNYDEQRILFTAFSVTDPRVVGFTRAWLDARPESAYAHTARAWLWWNAGWLVRGNSVIRYTYPEALPLFRLYHQKATEEAWTAYDLAPDLVAASDAVIRLESTTGGRRSLDEVVDEVMAVTPNSGTLLRATESASPKWGGSVEQMFSMCARHAGRVRDIPGYDAKVCAVIAIYNAGVRGEALDYADSLMAEGASAAFALPEMAHYQVGRIVRRLDKSPEAEKVLEAYFDLPEVTDDRAAFYYDHAFRIPKGKSAIAPQITRRKIDRARKELEFDPYEPSYLTTVSEIVVTGLSRDDSPSGDEVRGNMKKALIVAPYDAEIWQRLGYSFADQQVYVGAALPGDPYFENAIVYSNHRPDILLGYGDSQTTRIVNSLVKLGRDPLGAVAAADLAPDIEGPLCQVVRIRRLYQAACAAGGSYCGRDPYAVEDLSRLADNAAALGICEREAEADLAELIFRPRDVGLQVAEWE